MKGRILSLTTSPPLIQVDVFQGLERDLEIRKRFEEAAAMELQQGWDRGSKKTSVELAREAAEEAAREGEIRDLLRNRPDELQREDGGESVEARPRADAQGQGLRRSLEIQEMLFRRFGSIRR